MSEMTNEEFLKLPGVQEYLENLGRNSNNSPKPRLKIHNFNMSIFDHLHIVDNEKLNELKNTIIELRDKAGENPDDNNKILEKMYQDLLDDIEDELSDRNKSKGKGRKSRKTRKNRKSRKSRRT
jgi:hypothetical protein